jgi:tetratricopeptide (TPR) repeat protein
MAGGAAAEFAQHRRALEEELRQTRVENARLEGELAEAESDAAKDAQRQVELAYNQLKATYTAYGDRMEAEGHTAAAIEYHGKCLQAAEQTTDEAAEASAHYRLGRALVLWDGVAGSEEWVDSQLPPLLRGALQARGGGGDGGASGRDPPGGVDREALCACEAYVRAGACLALGLRYAGTCHAGAAAVLHRHARLFLGHRARVVDDPQDIHRLGLLDEPVA